MSGIRMQLGGRLYVGVKAGTRRFFKRLYSKLRRREERKQGDDAVTKRANYKGWYD